FVRHGIAFRPCCVRSIPTATLLIGCHLRSVHGLIPPDLHLIRTIFAYVFEYLSNPEFIYQLWRWANHTYITFAVTPEIIGFPLVRTALITTTFIAFNIVGVGGGSCGRHLCTFQQTPIGPVKRQRIL